MNHEPFGNNQHDEGVSAPSEGSLSALQPYDISQVPSGGPPFHHDVLTQVLLFVSDDLKTLLAISAVRRSWRFFSNYHPTWSLYGVVVKSNAHLMDFDEKQQEARERRKRQEKQEEDNDLPPVVYLKKLPEAYRKTFPSTRDGDIHSRIRSLKNRNAAGTKEQQEELRERKWDYDHQDSRLFLLPTLIVFGILMLLASITMASVGNTLPDGRVIYTRRNTAPSEGLNDMRVYMKGIGSLRKEQEVSGTSGTVTSSSLLLVRKCNGAVRSETTCDDSNECSTKEFWDECPFVVSPSTVFEDCDEIQSVTRNAVIWGFISSLLCLIGGMLVLCFSCATDARGASKVFWFCFLPWQILHIVPCVLSVVYITRIGGTPCPSWNTLMNAEGAGSSSTSIGGEGIKTSENGFQVDVGISYVTGPMITAIAILGLSTPAIFFAAWVLVDTRRQHRRSVKIRHELYRSPNLLARNITGQSLLNCCC